MFLILAFASVAFVAALFFVAPALGAMVVGLAALIFAPEIAVGVRAVLAVLRTREARIVGAIAASAAAISAAFGVGVGAAYAADAVATLPAVPVASAAPATVAVPWSDWLGAFLQASALVFVGLLSRLVALAPPVVKTFLTNDIITKAVGYAIATTRDAARGQTASIPVSNQLIAAALRWIVENEPKIAKLADDKLRPLIVAQLSARGMIPAEASSGNLAVTAPPAGA